MAWAQKLSGMGTPLLLKPQISLPHISTHLPLITTLRDYLTATGSSIILDKDFAVPFQRERDQHLMELVIHQSQIKFMPHEIRMINYCQHWLGVYTVSDIARACGIRVDTNFLNGKISNTSSTQKDLPVHQERPVSPRAWRAWRRAQALWCNLNTGRLHQPLGKWLHPSHELRRSWPFHLHQEARELLVRRDDGSFQTYQQIGTRNQFVQSSASTRVISLPPACFPVDCTRHSFYFMVTQTVRSGLTNRASSETAPETFLDFVKTQDEWIQRLVEHVKFLSTFEHLVDTLQTSSRFVAAGDGSVVASRGTFGWVLAVPNGEFLVECHGPAYGSPMDSFRAEGYGLLSILTFLHLLETHTNTPTPHLHLLCDNQAMINKVNAITKRLRPTFPNETLQPSWDVLQKIQQFLRDLPNGYKAEWIKGHQDQTTPTTAQSFEVKLNVRADELAGEFHQISPLHAESPTPMIEGTKCHLMINDQTISGKHKKQIRKVRPTQHLFQHLQRKHHWDDQTLNSIDWDSHTAAVHAWPNVARLAPTPPDPPPNGTTPPPPTGIIGQHSTFLTKFLHHWLPVGKLVSRYDSHTYSMKCATCDAPTEDTNHFLRCTGRANWRSTLRTDLRKLSEKLQSDPILTELLLEGIQTWLVDSPMTTSPRYTQPYQDLIGRQTKIGWQQLIYGRWAKEWKALQHQHLTRNNIPKTRKNHGNAWVKSHIILIWQACQAAWTSRNLDRHGADAHQQEQLKIQQAQNKIRVLYRLRPRCRLANHREWFHATPEEHFEREPLLHQLEAWLTTFEPMIRTRAQQHHHLTQQGLTAIDEAFERISLSTQTTSTHSTHTSAQPSSQFTAVASQSPSSNRFH